jgi:hypothetical protein
VAQTWAATWHPLIGHWLLCLEKFVGFIMFEPETYWGNKISCRLGYHPAYQMRLNHILFHLYLSCKGLYNGRRKGWGIAPALGSTVWHMPTCLIPLVWGVVMVKLQRIAIVFSLSTIRLTHVYRCVLACTGYELELAPSFDEQHKTRSYIIVGTSEYV